MVDEPRQGFLQPSLVPAGVALGSEEHCPLIVVEAVNLISELPRK